MKIIRKIFNVTNLLILTIILNSILLILLSIRTQNKNQTGKAEFEYIESKADDYLFNSDKIEYKVLKKDVVLYRSYDAELILDEKTSCYKTYELSQMENIHIGDIVNEESLLGYDDTGAIYPNEKCKIVNIVKSDDKYIVTVFSSKNYKVFAYVSQNDYYNYDFEKDSEITVLYLSETKKIKLNYLHLDYEYSVNDGYVRIVYEIIDDDFLLIPNSDISIRVEYKVLEDSYIVSMALFEGAYVGAVKQLTYREYIDGEYIYKNTEVTYVANMDDYAIIDCLNIEDIEAFYVVR